MPVPDNEQGTMRDDRQRARMTSAFCVYRTSWTTGEHRQDAQKGQTSHTPNPGAPRRALSQARPQRAKRRRRTLRYVELLSEARTLLADFFSFLRKHQEGVG